MVIPRFVRQALSGEDLTVYGDGTQARSFCHVADTVDALIALLDEPRAVGDVFNVGAQNETTILGLAELVLELTGSPSSIRFLSYEEAYEPGFEDMERRLPHIGKIQELLGWRPSRSLRDIVRDVVAFELARSVPMGSG
jgi:UDP-glucose 4-epimerase